MKSFLSTQAPPGSHQDRFELLARAGEALSRSLDTEETLRAIGETLVPAVADWCRVDLVDDQGVPQRRLAHHADPVRAALGLQRAREVAASPETPGSMAWVMKTGKDHYGHFDEPAALADDALRGYTQGFGMRAHYIVPLVARGRTIGAMGVVQAESGRELDVSDRALILQLAQRAALALDNARLYSIAESANRAKDEFLAMLGHELRNPLAPIGAALELMARREPHTHVEERRVIGRQVKHLSRLIDDLLDVSRITKGKIQLLREPVDMRDVVQQAVEQTRPLYEARMHGLSVDMPSRSAMVQGDGVRLAQVLGNLLVNAAKFTPADGRVRLSLRNGDGLVEACVADDGPGIDAALLPRVFDLFVQGEQGIDRRSGGLGLGLSIVRTLVELHGGTVGAASAGPGQGAAFTVRLPAMAAMAMDEAGANHGSGATGQASGQASGERPGGGGGGAPASPDPRAPGDAGRASPPHILVVDDNEDAAATLADLLQIVGFDAESVHHARDAVAAFQRKRPAVALLDIGLPDIDGYELARQLRSLPGGDTVKLVALTGYGRDRDRERAAGAGFDDHLVKPVDMDRLVDVITRLANPG